MNENKTLEKCKIYYGEPTIELQEEIEGNIGQPMPIQDALDSKPVLCLRLKLEGMRFEGSKMIFPDVCWEKMCKTKPRDVIAPQPIDRVEFRRLADEIDDQIVLFGDFKQIIKTLRPKIESKSVRQNAV